MILGPGLVATTSNTMVRWFERLPSFCSVHAIGIIAYIHKLNLLHENNL